MNHGYSASFYVAWESSVRFSETLFLIWKQDVALRNGCDRKFPEFLLKTKTNVWENNLVMSVEWNAVSKELGSLCVS